MRMNRTYKFALGLALLACTLPAAAQTADTAKPADTTPAAAPAPPPDPLAGITSVLHGVNLTGLVDGYYQYNANHPVDGTYTTPFTSASNAFGLNLLELQLDKPVDKTSPIGFRVALGFGDAMTAFEGSDGNASSTQYLKEGYLSYMAPIGKGLQFDFGKYVTPAGAEVLESNQNWNYTRSLLFYNAIPYYHFGVRAKYNLNAKWSVTGFASNGWNNVVSTNSGKTGGVSISYAGKKFGLTETYLTGPRDLGHINDNGPWNNLTDTVLTYNPNAKLSLMANFDYDHQGSDALTDTQLGLSTRVTGADYAGIAGYVKYAVTPKVNVVARYEYLNDHDGLALGLNGGIEPILSKYSLVLPRNPALALLHDHPQEFTATLERTFAGHLVSRLEYRHDFSNNNIFESGGNFSKGTLPSFVGGQDTVAIGLMLVLQPAQ
jgi:hypothetical protein